MKIHRFSACLLVLLFCGCTADSVAGSTAPTPSPAAVQTAENAAVSPHAPADAVPVSGAPVRPYDEMQFCRIVDTVPDRPSGGYWAVSQDGKWGLMRNNGAELLPCQADTPPYRCAINQQWHWEVTGMDWDIFDQYSAQMVRAGEQPLCGGHGGNSLVFLWENTRRQALECGLSEASCLEYPLSPADALVYGDILPAYRADYVDGNGDPDYYSFDSQGNDAIFLRIDGTLLTDDSYQSVGWFFDEALAPAKRDGKWAYLDRTGQPVTDFVYDDAMGENQANPFYSGYAAVCRDGRWGLLDSTGAECIPCEYDGLCWDGAYLWIRLEDGWHCYRWGSAEPLTEWPGDHADLSKLNLPAEMPAPDTPRSVGQIRYCYTTAQSGLILRSGPGTNYERLDLLPENTRILPIGTLSTAPGWVLTWYNGQYGWISTDYLFSF